MLCMDVLVGSQGTYMESMCDLIRKVFQLIITYTSKMKTKIFFFGFVVVYNYK